MIRMCIALAIIIGIALLFQIILRCRTGDGWILTLAFIMILMVALGKMHLWKLCVLVCALVGVCGYLISVIYIFVNRKKAIKQIITPAMLGILMLGICGIVLFHGGFWHLEKEFTIYGQQIRSLYEAGGLSSGAEYSGITLLLLFFERITGLQDSVMYMGMFLLTSIGFLLPLQRCSFKDWRKVLIYLLIVYASVYSLFTHGFYSLYPELATAALLGGLMLRNHDRRMDESNEQSNGHNHNQRRNGVADYLVLAAGLLLLLTFCKDTGPMAAICLAGYVFYERFLTKKTEDYPLVLRFIIIAGILLILFMAMAFSSDYFGHGINLSNSGRFLTVICGGALGARSRLSLGFLPFMLAISIAWGVLAAFDHDKRGKVSRIGYMWIFIFFYLIATFILCHMGTEGYALDTVGLEEMLSIPAIAFLMILVMNLLFVEEKAFKGMSIYAALLLALFFLSGWNETVLADYSALDIEGTENYETVQYTKELFSKLEKRVTKNDKVLVISQNEDSYVADAMAVYYLGGQASDYRKDVWMITEGGYYKDHLFYRDKDFSYKEYLQKSDFDYVLIVQTDDYISNMNKSLLEDMTIERIIKAILYKIN